MCPKFIVFIVIAISYKASGLNENEYQLMPPIFHLDPYEACIHQHEGIYCSVELHLVTDEPSDLYNMIQEYSTRSITHYNYTILQYGICLTETCKKYHDKKEILDQKELLEGCLNETLWRDYKLKARVVPDKVLCEKYGTNNEYDGSYVLVAVVIGVILLVNLVGSLVEICKNKQENGFWACFSIFQNWRSLVGSTEDHPDPHLKRLKGLYGVRSLITITIILGHSPLLFLINSDNPKFMEEIYREPIIMLVTNGTLSVQIFFTMSAFLLGYHMSVYEETHKTSWGLLLKGIIIRWLRLSASYAVVLGITATWLQKAGSGPLWQRVVVQESNDCRRGWLGHLLYYHNYIDDSLCMGQTWYLASDFQLHVIGLVVLMMTRGRVRTIVMSVLCMAAVIVPALHTYYQDLEAFTVLGPEATRSFFRDDPTFKGTHKRSHTNFASLTVGLALGLAVYRWQRTGYQFSRYFKNRFLPKTTLPAIFGLIYFGSMFYQHTPKPSVLLRAFVAAIIKPIFSSIFAYATVGMVFKFEDTYRSFFEWNGWVPVGRLSYSAYLLHLLVLKYLIGIQPTLVHATAQNMLGVAFTALVLTFLCALPLYLLVEVPVQKLVKLATTSAAKKHAVKKDAMKKQS